MYPRFSVVIPCYNRATTVLPTLKSVQDQTFSDFECIVVDDGSADGEDLAKVVAGLNDPRFRLIRRENGGGGAARNTGIESARGAWIAFLDSDDLFLPHKLESAYYFFKDAADNDVFCSRIIVDRGNGVLTTKPMRRPNIDEAIDAYLMADRGFIQTSTIVLRTALARSIQFDESLPFSQDTDFCVRGWTKGAHFHMSEECLVVWMDRTTDGRVSSNSKISELETWLDKLRPEISDRAYWGYRGWRLAKLRRATSLFRALGDWLVAVSKLCYSPKLAATIFLQIILPAQVYRDFSDFAIRRFNIGV